MFHKKVTAHGHSHIEVAAISAGSSALPGLCEAGHHGLGKVGNSFISTRDTVFCLHLISDICLLQLAS